MGFFRSFKELCGQNFLEQIWFPIGKTGLLIFSRFLFLSYGPKCSRPIRLHDVFKLHLKKSYETDLRWLGFADSTN